MKIFYLSKLRKLPYWFRNFQIKKINLSNNDSLDEFKITINNHYNSHEFYGELPLKPVSKMFSNEEQEEF
jgi:hypothetical protein